MVKIDKERCIGCGICQEICPSGFEVINGKSNVKDGNADCIQQAAEACPKNAIILDDSSDSNSSGNSDGGMHRSNSFGGGMHRGKGNSRGGGMHRGRRF